MSQLVKEPTHHRLNIAFKSLGPYLREEKYHEGVYLFDCLAVCIDDKKSPEHREFWGWWMELKFDHNFFEASYAVGRFDLEGKWVDETPEDHVMEEVIRTKNVFHEKLVKMLHDKFSCDVKIVEPLVETK
ncbi:sigma factor-binding protein Crl [Vibrio quintilis]|uniref:Sigma factor-binding protein Crl n=1 Tax=Vibrio quintilis TaxID=1117707 RepID=A0A1M7Z0W1_9VIBR|nr:sigma factor-binding protein Crl [Vibrio quintilis]SHO58483.1 Sigma factor-binding protein Crl [Vibrio quintilis]